MNIESIREVYQANNFNSPSRMELSTALIALDHYEESLEILKLSRYEYLKLLRDLKLDYPPDFDPNTITYDELRDWRDLVEFGLRCGLNQIPQFTRKSGYFVERFPDHLQYLLTPVENPYRSKLWELAHIQFFYWLDRPRKQQGWWMRGGYEYKIYYLEKRYLLGDKSPVPMPWIEDSLMDRLIEIAIQIDAIGSWFPQQHELRNLKSCVQYCRECLRLLREG